MVNTQVAKEKFERKLCHQTNLRKGLKKPRKFWSLSRNRTLIQYCSLSYMVRIWSCFNSWQSFIAIWACLLIHGGKTCSKIVSNVRHNFFKKVDLIFHFKLPPCKVLYISYWFLKFDVFSSFVVLVLCYKV